MPIFTDILEEGRRSFSKPGGLDSRDWFRERAREVRNVNPNNIIRSNRELNRNIIRPGFLYLFNYDPLNKQKLPYYDRFPLVFPFHDDGDSFLGMNLHYIPHIYRARLMDLLYDLTNNDKFNETTKIRASYQLLSSAARYKYFTPCVKRYLYSHVKSRFLLIPANEWDIALFLPLERFNKAGLNQVYKDSRKIINGL
jgi:hypothetical protein